MPGCSCCGPFFSSLFVKGLQMVLGYTTNPRNTQMCMLIQIHVAMHERHGVSQHGLRPGTQRFLLKFHEPKKTQQVLLAWAQNDCSMGGGLGWQTSFCDRYMSYLVTGDRRFWFSGTTPKGSHIFFAYFPYALRNALCLPR